MRGSWLVVLGWATYVAFLLLPAVHAGDIDANGAQALGGILNIFFQSGVPNRPQFLGAVLFSHLLVMASPLALFSRSWLRICVAWLLLVGAGLQIYFAFWLKSQRMLDPGWFMGPVAFVVLSAALFIRGRRSRPVATTYGHQAV